MQIGGNCKLFAPKFKRVSNEEAFAHIGFIEVDAEKFRARRQLSGQFPYLAVFNKYISGGFPSKKKNT